MIEIWPKEVKMILREKFQKTHSQWDNQKQKEHWTCLESEKQCLSLSFTTESSVNTGRLLLTSLTLFPHMYHRVVTTFSREDQIK